MSIEILSQHMEAGGRAGLSAGVGRLRRNYFWQYDFNLQQVDDSDF
jgi:hypothetical protein